MVTSGMCSDGASGDDCIAVTGHFAPVLAACAEEKYVIVVFVSAAPPKKYLPLFLPGGFGISGPEPGHSQGACGRTLAGIAAGEMHCRCSQRY